MTVATKRCPGCNTFKPLSSFHTNASRRGGLQGYCKSCMRTYRRRYQAVNPEMGQNSHLKREYNITLADYNRAFAEQGGLCAICAEPGTKARRLQVDHDHATGRVRKLLCKNCNCTIGYAKESPARLRAAADYLERQAAEVRASA